ncbi:MAG TPA: fatty acid--CoA ligase family protein [Opitutus sp.]|nr:fatty acid--CoA ligase family protein [Opitutus sp.]
MTTPAGITWFWEALEHAAPREMLWRDGRAHSYGELLAAVADWEARLEGGGVARHARVAIVGEFGFEPIALLLALIRREAVIVPLANDDAASIAERVQTAGVQVVVDFRDGAELRAVADAAAAAHPLIEECARQATAGIVMFTSGSTGKGKAVLYRADHLIGKFRDAAKKPHRTLLFLKFDHIGGLNTLFAVLSAGGTVVSGESRQAEDICRLVQEARVSLLPTTPSFLSMLVMSGRHEQFDLGSLEVITYGTEVMPQSTLLAVARLFPRVKLKQTYGLTELGILGTVSRANDSKWVKLGGDGVEWKVVDGTLRIRTATPMVGYLNAPSPFDAAGWYDTEDQVEVDGEYLKFLGRKSEVINVGGEKVHPQEVEDVLLAMPNVAEVRVRGASSPVTGQTVCADVVLRTEEDLRAFRRRLRAYCADKLARYKIPTQVRLSESRFTGSRLKKVRRTEDAA